VVQPRDALNDPRRAPLWCGVIGVYHRRGEQLSLEIAPSVLAIGPGQEFSWFLLTQCRSCLQPAEVHGNSACERLQPDIAVCRLLGEADAAMRIWRAFLCDYPSHPAMVQHDTQHRRAQYCSGCT
jgi:hypothetical protein